MVYFCMIDRCKMRKLFFFRQTLLIVFLIGLTFGTKAQIVDGLIGQRRDVAQVLLRPFRIVDYKKERTVFSVETGIHQTVFYENDSCNRFYWAVTPDQMEYFLSQLKVAGYRKSNEDLMVKDSLELTVKKLESGKATLFIASISKNLEGERDASGRKIVKRPESNMETMPLLQQTILAEDLEKKTKPPKDPKRHWVGGKRGETSILGWEK